MPVDRPTFSESWYRVAALHPRLRSTVQVHRQHFRAQMWHVLQDPASNQFFRLNEPAYRFVALLDGRRTVSEAWRIANEQLGDDAPTQGEVIQLLGQLHVSNLLQAELPPDAEAMFDRYRKRVRREVQSYVANLLFARVPLLDPDRFLTRWAGLFGRAFSVPGMVLWLMLLGAGFYCLAGRMGDLVLASNGIFDPGNLPFLYLALILVKVFHEFGHAFACKRFGLKSGTGGEVHVMGVMFLVFTPIPYMDASSAWALRSKWHRMVIGAAGMLVELAAAAVAAIVWANTREGSVHAVAYNMMFIASVSSLLFNGNPLLRFDAYYVLSDLLEIPNLWNRGRQYLYYLVRKYVWGVRQARSPAHARGERFWMVLHAVASSIYRVFIFVAILLFLGNRLPRDLAVIAAAFGLTAVVAWLFVPVGKFVHYLATHGELARVRTRAVVTTLSALAAALVCIGAVPFPDRSRVEGVVEPVELSIIYAAADGFVTGYLPSGSGTAPEASPVVEEVNADLSSHREELLAQRRGLEARRRLAMTEEVAAAQVFTEQIAAIEDQIQRVTEELASLALHAPFAGTWVAPDVDRLCGAYLHRGDRVGLVASLDNVLIRATAGQDVAVGEESDRVEIRVKGRPDQGFPGTITKRLRVGQEQLPSAALGYRAGGAIALSPEDPSGTKAAEPFFELHIRPDPNPSVQLLSGQRVVVRLEMPPKPLLLQWWWSLLRLIQKRFFI